MYNTTKVFRHVAKLVGNNLWAQSGLTEYKCSIIKQCWQRYLRIPRVALSRALSRILTFQCRIRRVTRTEGKKLFTLHDLGVVNRRVGILAINRINYHMQMQDKAPFNKSAPWVMRVTIVGDRTTFRLATVRWLYSLINLNKNASESNALKEILPRIPP